MVSEIEPNIVARRIECLTSMLYAFVEILGVTSAASDKEIKRAFLLKAKQYHPDVNQSAEAPKKFAQINEAYETLGDVQRRRIYDATGMSSNEQQNADQRGESFGFNPFGFAFSAFRKSSATQEQAKSFEEILKEFEQFFDITDLNVNDTSSATSDARRGKGIIKGRDVQQATTISFKESALGCTKEVSFARNEVCQTCDGTGEKPRAPRARCTACNGSGYIVETINNMTMAQIECEECDGLGYIVPPCLSCSGLGSIRQQVTEKIKIPAGVYSGLILRSQGKGN